MPELPERVSRVVLIGLMGAGKTTVGQLLARRLGWTFFDLDRSVEARAGSTVQQIFEQSGEQTFRSLEQQLTGELASRSRVVLAPGGGWVMRNENVQLLPRDSAVFWLRVSPEEAVHRLQGSPEVRPLLAGADPVERARELAQQRTARYAQLGWAIETEGRAPADIVTEIVITLGPRLHTRESATD